MKALRFFLRLSLMILVGALWGAGVMKIVGGELNDTDFVLRSTKKVALQWHFHDEWRVWLTAFSYNSDYQKEGYHPSFTFVVSDYKPMVKQLPSGKWQVTFTSELAEELP